MHHITTTLKHTSAVTSLVVLSVLLFAAWGGSFRSDDFSHLETARFEVVNNPIAIITGAEFIGGGGHYRPMMKLFFWVNYLAFGLDPLGYFISTIVLLLINVLLLFLLAKLVFGDALGAYSTILLFLLQGNIYLYTVNWIGAVNNIFVGIFVVAALVFYDRSRVAARHTNLLYALSLICFAFALLSREIAVILIPVIFIYDLLFPRSKAPSTMANIVRRLVYYVPYLILLGCAIFFKSASGTRELTSYGFAPGNALDRLLFFGLHLGFLPAAVLILTILSLMLGERRFEEWNLKLAIWGLSYAAVAVLPFLLLGWSSPTWLYLPAFGTTLAAAAMFHQVLSNTLERNSFFLIGVLVWAIIGNSLLFIELSNNQWWQWGKYIEDVIEEVQAQYPEPPRGAVLVFIDEDPGESTSIHGLFRTQHNISSAFRLCYDDPSLHAYFVESAGSVENLLEERHSDVKEKEGSPEVAVFEYSGGSVYRIVD